MITSGTMQHLWHQPQQWWLSISLVTNYSNGWLILFAYLFFPLCMLRSRLVHSLSIQIQTVSFGKHFFQQSSGFICTMCQNRFQWMDFQLCSKISHFFFLDLQTWLSSGRSQKILTFMIFRHNSPWLVKYTYNLVVFTNIQYSDSNGVKFGCTSLARNSVDLLHVVCNWFLETA